MRIRRASELTALLARWIVVAKICIRTARRLETQARAEQNTAAVQVSGQHRVFDNSQRHRQPPTPITHTQYGNDRPSFPAVVTGWGMQVCKKRCVGIVA